MANKCGYIDPYHCDGFSIDDAATVYDIMYNTATVDQLWCWWQSDNRFPLVWMKIFSNYDGHAMVFCGMLRTQNVFLLCDPETTILHGVACRDLNKEIMFDVRY